MHTHVTGLSLWAPHYADTLSVYVAVNTWKPTSVGAYNLIVEIYINIAYGQLLMGNYCGLCVQRLPLPQAFHHCK